ncbi:MAG: GDP-mannose 4,6-dehydratase, partial [Bdellovibrionales bacterium]|nr:GDP-mannose 4,6-dehydratase [Bdellovibrionales bacterium]
MISKTFWQGRRVLLTGHTGFKGSWLAALLTELGARTCGISLAPSTHPNHFSLLQEQLKIESHELDIRNFELLQKQVHAFQPEVVFHLAAQALVRESYANPL